MSLRISFVAAVLMFAPACDHGSDHALGPGRDLRGAPRAALEAPDLLEWPLQSHADYDAVEAAFEARASLPDLASLLLGLTERRGDDPLLLGRTALLWLDGRAGERSLKVVFDLVDKVRALAPDAPDTKYLLLAVKRSVVWDPATRAATVPVGQDDIARKFVSDVDALLAASPDFRGPGGVTSETLRAERAAVAATLEREAAEASGGDVPDGAPLGGESAKLWQSWAGFVVALDSQGTRKACALAPDIMAANPPADIAAVVQARCPSAAHEPQ